MDRMGEDWDQSTSEVPAVPSELVFAREQRPRSPFLRIAVVVVSLVAVLGIGLSVVWASANTSDEVKAIPLVTAPTSSTTTAAPTTTLSEQEQARLDKQAERERKAAEKMREAAEKADKAAKKAKDYTTTSIYVDPKTGKTIIYYYRQ